jgi:hypothetical protein
LQGRLFHRFRAVIMGWKHIDTLKDPVPSPSEERVGDTDESGTVQETAKKPRTYAQALKAQQPLSFSLKEKPIKITSSNKKNDRRNDHSFV